MENKINREKLKGLLDKATDLTSQVIYFPVRHHSPVCSLKLQDIIKEFKPEHILIEGPYDFNEHIHLLTEPDSIAPFAIYSFFIDNNNLLGQNGILTPSEDEKARYRAWYPFTDYSPELVALRQASKIGAQARFVDLPYSEILLSKKCAQMEEDTKSKGESMVDDYLIQRSKYVRLLCEKRGCRDYNDLWDDLFEVGGIRQNTLDFIRTFLTFCYLSRVDYTDEMLRSEGCDERELFMAANVSRLMKSGGKILVVTGGFHTVALPDLVEQNPPLKTLPVHPPDSFASYLIRFSFELMDRHRGYESGMPSPAYYQEVWKASQNCEGDSDVALKFITEIARQARKEGENVSTAETIEAYTLSINLSRFRGREGITREDLLDSLRTAFVKGALNLGGYTKILNIAQSVLRGKEIGSVTGKAGQPPIIQDFYKKLKDLSLENLTSEKKDIKLNLYRKPSHREKSQFLHQLNFLGTPYGYLQQGPDFVRGKNLNLLFENWVIIWRPDIESLLIEKSLYGSTISDASAALLKERLGAIERQASRAASLLLDCCRMGLQNNIKSLLDILSSILHEDQDFSSLVSAMGDICIVYKYRDALNSTGLDSLIPIIELTYRQSLCLLAELPCVNEDIQREILQSFQRFHYITISFRDALLDREIYLEALKRGLEAGNGLPLIRGAFTGALYGCGEISEEKVSLELLGYLRGTNDHVVLAADFLEGLLTSAKHIFFESSLIFKDLHNFLDKCDEDTFLVVLPGLRRAFTALTPRETELMAGKITRFLGISSDNLFLTSEIPVSVTARGLELDKRVTELMIFMGVLK